ncbi:MAG TPA: Hint domain-containing protein [Paracoccaceae bacterium]
MRQSDDAEQGEEPVAPTDGILAGTPIATPAGWRRVETLRPGDAVLTFEAGEQRLEQVNHHLAGEDDIGDWPQGHWPLQVPVGALENREEIVLLRDQRVLIESDAADDLYGDPFTLIPAVALQGYRGIDLCRPPGAAEAVRLGFAADQIVYAARGALLACPEMQLGLHADIDALKRRAARGDYPALSDAQARELVICLIAEDLGAALRVAGRPASRDQAAFF